MKRILLFLTFLFLSIQGFSQPINVNTTTYTVPQLVREKLFSLQPGQTSNGCTGAISNITWSTGTNFGQANGIGYFTNTNPNFPLTEGVVLATRSALTTAGPNVGEPFGATSWPGDAQLFNYIQGLGIDPGLNSYNDATKIEFDFVPLTNTMSFDFLFASDEYGDFQCQFADAFAFFLTNVTAGTPSTNLALIPNTTIPISVTTIRNSAFNGFLQTCASANPTYFGSYSPGNGNAASQASATDFNGKTVVMTAQSPVISGNTYHIKLVIADRNDGAYDSAVFLAAGSFNFPVQTNGFGSTGFLVSDQTAICYQKTRDVSAQLSPTPGAIYTWSQNGTPIPNSNNNVYTIAGPGSGATGLGTGPGTYQVSILNPNGTTTSSCPFPVEFFPPLPIIPVGTNIDLTAPVSNPVFNLNSNTNPILNGNNINDYPVSYHTTFADAQLTANAILNPGSYIGFDGQQIFVSVRDNVSGNMCDENDRSFFLRLVANAGTDGSTLVCDSSTAPIDLFSLITGEDIGGVWTQTSGTGGTFNAAAGTYTPVSGATTSTFLYTVSNSVAPIVSDSSTATVNINFQPNAGVDGGTTVCETSTVAILLSDLITGEQTGGVWTQTGGTGGTFDPVAGTFTLAVGATTSTFQYTITGVAPCIDDFSIATVTINAQPNAGVDGGTTVCETDITAIDLFSLITGEQAGGVWTRTSGTGGTFIAAAGTFTPAIGATSSTFVYTLPGVAPCAADTSIATVTINRQPNAGVDGATNVCESSTDPINLFSLIAGEQPGGVWTQTSGTGGTFDGATGTFTPGFGATTSTFTYTIAGIAPCIDDASVVTITFVTAPAINQPTPFIVCDDSLNNDGIYCFDLTTKDAEITTDPTVDITYHYTQTDALTGANPLPNPFCNNDPSFQTIYVRVFDPLAPQCPSTTTLDLIINPLPIANPVITDYVLCDVNNSPDGMEQFDLSTKDLEIANGQTGVVVTYYLTQQDAIDQVTPSLPTLYTNATPNQQQIWINIAYTATGCNSVSSFNLIVNPLPLSTQPGYPQYELCDYDTAQIGFEQFDLSTQVTPVLLGQNGMSVGFYPTLTDAQDDTNEITNLLYTNVQQFVQTLGIRITNDATGCYVISTMDLVVNPLPILVQPTQPYVVCDTDQDGQSSSFDLNTLTPIIDPSSSYTINYYLTIEDANSDTNPIDLTVPFTNNVTIQFLYVRGEDANGCYSVIQIELDVNPAPIIPTTLPNLVECDDDANTQNGITAFDLTQQTAVILAAQTGPASDYTVNYYTSLADANVPQNAIIQTTNYQGTNGQTIWVVVRNLTTTCPSIGSFQLVVNTPIVLTTPTLYKVCDDDAIPNNLFTTFDLVSFIGTIPGHTITFYLDSAHTQLITTPGAFENNVPANQTIFLVATNDTTGCISTRTLTLSVLRVPTPNDNPPTSPAFIMCEDPANPGMATFDITQNAAFIANNDPNVTLHYYYNQTDLANHANEITNPTSVLLGDPALLAVTPTPINLEQYVYIAVTFNTPPAPTDSNNFACYKEVRQGFIVNPLPIVGLLGNGNQYQICEEDPTLNDGMEEFDLTSQIGALLAGNSTTPASTYDVAFYTSNPPSAATQIQNPSAYTNTTANSQTIYVVVTNTTTGCESGVGQFNIVVNPKPEATAPDDFETCDTDGTNDGLYLYPLTALEATILGATQLPADYEVTFYDTTLADAEADLNAIADEANYMASTHTIWVRVTNNVTECYKIVSFEIVVERLPEPVIVSDNGGHILCVDFLTNQVARPLLLTATNTVPGTFTYQWFVDGVALPGETNQTYQVPAVAGGATRNYTVVMTSTSGAVTPACDELSDPFEVIQSGQAAIISGVGYTVTNAFTNNQVITVTGIDGYGTYAYSLDDGPIQTSPIFENVSLGDHTIYVWDTTDPNYSCDRLPIFNVQTIDYPHYFTPNGDGFHDTWNIVGLSSYPNTKIYIFDRYGKLLKQISASGDGWDGTFNGQLLPATDYWFTVEFQESSISQAFKQFKAHFSLKR